MLRVMQTRLTVSDCFGEFGRAVSLNYDRIPSDEDIAEPFGRRRCAEMCV